MTFDEILGQVLQLLQRQGRVSYRALKRRFTLDDEYLEDLVEHRGCCSLACWPRPVRGPDRSRRGCVRCTKRAR